MKPSLIYYTSFLEFVNDLHLTLSMPKLGHDNYLGGIFVGIGITLSTSALFLRFGSKNAPHSKNYNIQRQHFSLGRA